MSKLKTRLFISKCDIPSCKDFSWWQGFLKQHIKSFANLYHNNINLVDKGSFK